MRQKTKDILAIILIIIIVVQLLIYKSELNFVFSDVFKITFINLVALIGFIFWYSKKSNHRILLTFAIVGISFLIFFFEFVNAFSGTEKRFNSWEINDYEVIYATQEFFAGPGSEPYLKLRKEYSFGLFYKDIDKTKTNISFLKLGKTDCFVEFTKSRTKFDLCKKKQLK